MGKFYFQDGDENCYGLEYHREFMKENGLTELELFEAKREIGTGYFYCREFMEVGDVGEGCGKFCEKYQPNNGKNGRCKHYGWCYEQTENKIILRA